MAKLDEILKGISKELLGMQEETDRKSLQVLQSYQGNEIMKHLDAPRFTISGVRLNLKFTVSDLNELESFDFSKTRADWLKYIKQIPVDYLSFVANKGKTGQFKKRLEQSFSKINPPNYQVGNYLTGNVDLVDISSNHIVSFLNALPEEDKIMLPQNITSKIPKGVQDALNGFKKFADLEKEIKSSSKQLGKNWLSAIQKVPAAIITWEAVEGLSSEEKRAIKASVNKTFNNLSGFNFRIENALGETSNLKMVKTRDYLNLLYDELPEDLKERVPPSYFLSSQQYGEVEKILENNLVSIRLNAEKSITEAMGRLWPQQLKQITDNISGNVNIGLKNLEKPDPRGARPGTSFDRLPGMTGPVTPREFRFEPKTIQLFNKLTPTLTLKQVLSNTVTNASVDGLAREVHSVVSGSTVIPQDKKINKSVLTNDLKSNLKELLPQIKADVFEKAENQLGGLIKDFAENTIRRFLDEKAKDNVLKELEGKSKQVNINDLNVLTEKALLLQKDELLDKTRLALLDLPDKISFSSKQKIKANVLNTHSVNIELNGLFNRVFDAEIKRISGLIQDFTKQWHGELITSSLKTISDTLLSYEIIIDDFAQSIAGASMKSESIVITDNDLMMAIQRENDSNLISKSSSYLVSLLRGNAIPAEIRISLPKAFLKQQSFSKLLADKLNAKKADLKKSVIVTRALNDLDISVKDSDIKNSSAINEISIDLTPNFIKLTDE
jgi:hypothetical protein